MKIFLTGATGYIGHQLALKLLNEGHEIHALARKKVSEDLMKHPRFHFFQGDLLNSDSIDNAMRNCDSAFHLAAIAKVYLKDNSEYYKVNVVGTVNVLDVALSNQVKKIVFTSSAAVYGVSHEQPINEDHLRAEPFFTDYEASKFIAEERVQHYVRKGLQVVIVHPTKVYGPGLDTESNAVSNMIRLFLKGRWRIIPGDGKMIGNFSFIDDIVNGHILALQYGKAGEKYVLGGSNLSFNDLFTLVKKISGKSFTTFHVPYPLMIAYGWFEELKAKIFGIDPKITRPWIRKYNHDLALSVEKARDELGYSVTPIEEGLKKTIDWLTNRKNDS